MIFAGAHYAALAIFVASCWGFGRALMSPLMARIGAPARRDLALEMAMAAALGVGLFVCAFQALAIAHRLNAVTVLLVVAVGFAAACMQAPSWLRQRSAWRATDIVPPWTGIEKAALAALALVALPSLVAPLAPPAAFDELMYHLPYARQVALTGSLGIHEWLRYPWFPYNYNLLYAAALLVGDDVLPHFLTALAGWLSVWMVYRLGTLHVNRVVGAVGAAIWLGLGDYANSLIDMGVALFVLSACVALWWWREAQIEQPQAGEPAHRGTHWLAIAAFFLGLAAGSKYQALTFLPLVAVFVVRRERRVGVWGIALVCFLLPCIYWYARNAITTGDPFNPIGAKLFGFTNWNAADYQQQFYDVGVHAAVPNVLIWPVLLAPLHAAWKRSAAVRAAVVFCAWSIVVWLATSRYPRYLTASFPLIALCAVLGWQVLLGWVAAGVQRLLPARKAAASGPSITPTAANTAVASASGASRTRTVFLGLLLAALVVASAQQTSRKIAMVATTPAERETFLRANVPGYEVMDYLRHNATGKVYQVALSEAMYYGPDAVWGDALGPWRYGDYITLPPAALAKKLASQGFEAIVMTSALAPGLSAQPGFADHFETMIARDGAIAYRVRSFAP